MSCGDTGDAGPAKEMVEDTVLTGNVEYLLSRHVTKKSSSHRHDRPAMPDLGSCHVYVCMRKA